MQGTRCRLVIRTRDLIGSRCLLNLFRLTVLKSLGNHIYPYNSYIIILSEYIIQNLLLKQEMSSKNGFGQPSGAAIDKTLINC